MKWIIGSDWRPETNQGIEGKLVRFRSGRVRDRLTVRDKDRRSEPNTVQMKFSQMRTLV